MREALCVELHNPNVRIFAGDSEDSGLVGWTDWSDEATEKFTVPGEQLQILCEHLQIDTVRRYPPKQKYSMSLEDADFDFFHKTPYNANTEGKQAISIFVEVLGPNLINILVNWQFGKEERSPEDFSNLTYCGPFTIWWKKDIVTNSNGIDALTGKPVKVAQKR